MKFNSEMIDNIVTYICIGMSDNATWLIIENIRTLSEILDIDKEQVLREMAAEIAKHFNGAITAVDIYNDVHRMLRLRKRLKA
jgi:hypothetical protein